MTRLTRHESQVQTRERLLAAAAEIFVEDGFGRASVDAVAERAGYSKGAVYSNFDGKEDLFLELLRRKLEGDVAELRAMMQASADVDDLMAALRTYLSGHGEVLDFTRVAAEFLAQARNPSPYAEACARLYADQRAALAELLTVFFQRVGLQPPAPVARLAAGLVATTLGLAVQRSVAPDVITAELWGASVESALRMMLAAASA